MAQLRRFASFTQSRALRDFLTTAAAALALSYFGTPQSDRFPG
ncbi:hypothetical protein SAMN05446935_6958 [Burkholderia sp. YR290]|jgi:hypothetical protein|nr:hypothetical protein [Paraburkholderia hospita]SKC90815.1 hypothetical protein SAMN05446934_5613 [Paraburkholderia hospita]SOE86453.1 hypothetical protein SAMN05446935_6958 [Burkholderia sp. YR290]